MCMVPATVESEPGGKPITGRDKKSNALDLNTVYCILIDKGCLQIRLPSMPIGRPPPVFLSCHKKFVV